MKKEVLDLHARFCKTFSHSKRLEIIHLLKEGEQSAGDITRRLGIAKANTSQHLTRMREMKILRIRKAGNNIYYRLSNSKISEACTLMQDALAQLIDSVPAVNKASINHISERIAP